MNRHAKDATSTLCFYLETNFDRWVSDNTAEVESIVEGIVDAALAEVTEKYEARIKELEAGQAILEQRLNDLIEVF